MPPIALGLAPLTTSFSLLLLGGYPVLAYQIYRRQQQEGLNSKQAWLYSIFCLLGKFAGVQGQIAFHKSRLLGKKTAIMEYKTTTSSISLCTWDIE